MHVFALFHSTKTSHCGGLIRFYTSLGVHNTVFMRKELSHSGYGALVR